jgi:hypothetical protein
MNNPSRPPTSLSIPEKDEEKCEDSVDDHYYLESQVTSQLTMETALLKQELQSSRRSSSMNQAESDEDTADTDSHRPVGPLACATQQSAAEPLRIHSFRLISPSFLRSNSNGSTSSRMADPCPGIVDSTGCIDIEDNGEYWVRLVPRQQAAGMSLLQDSSGEEDFFTAADEGRSPSRGDPKAKAGPACNGIPFVSILPLQSIVSGEDDAPSLPSKSSALRTFSGNDECFLCIDVEGRHISIKDMRLPTTTDPDSNADTSNYEFRIARDGQSLLLRSSMEELPRRQMRLLYHGDRLCVYERQSSLQTPKVILEYRMEMSVRAAGTQSVTGHAPHQLGFLSQLSAPPATQDGSTSRDSSIDDVSDSAGSVKRVKAGAGQSAGKIVDTVTGSTPLSTTQTSTDEQPYQTQPSSQKVLSPPPPTLSADHPSSTATPQIASSNHETPQQPPFTSPVPQTDGSPNLLSGPSKFNTPVTTNKANRGLSLFKARSTTDWISSKSESNAPPSKSSKSESNATPSKLSDPQESTANIQSSSDPRPHPVNSPFPEEDLATPSPPNRSEPPSNCESPNDALRTPGIQKPEEDSVAKEETPSVAFSDTGEIARSDEPSEASTVEHRRSARGKRSRTSDASDTTVAQSGSKRRNTRRDSLSHSVTETTKIRILVTGIEKMSELEAYVRHLRNPAILFYLSECGIT